MLRQRLLILLGGSLLAASAALADDVGYIDCNSHSEETQIFAKARKTPDVVASVPCGERFTILIYGFVFSRIETRDGKVGFVYSNLIAIDHSGIPVQQQASTRTPAAAPAAANTTASVAQQNLPAAAPAMPVAAQPASAQPVAVQPAATQPAPAAAPAQATAPTANFSDKSAVIIQSDPASSQTDSAHAPVAPVPAIPAPAQVDPAPAASAPASPSASTVPEPAAPAAQPDPPAPARPQPAPPRSAMAEAAAPAPAPAPAIRPKDARSSWERPIPSAHTPPHLELFGGYAFARTVSAGTSTNLNGALGSFGWNFKPWLQVVGDSSYNFVTVGTTKNILYGNHYGARYFYRSQNRWHATPFVEGLVGASRADTTVSGTGGYKTSQNCISYKVGGGLDIHPSRHVEIRLFDFDYYRTSFGTNASQNNYWVSTGIVLRLFGGVE